MLPKVPYRTRNRARRPPGDLFPRLSSQTLLIGNLAGAGDTAGEGAAFGAAGARVVTLFGVTSTSVGVMTLGVGGVTRLNPAGIGGVSFARFAGVAGRYS